MTCSNSWSCPPGSFPYIVSEGDTLYSIALRYQSSAERLAEVNPNADPNNLRIGEVLCIPLPHQFYPMCRTMNYYVVGAEDTFYSISRYFGITEQQLSHYNMGVEPANIYEGMILCIPIAPPPICITVENGMMTLDFVSGDIERFSCTMPETKQSTRISAKQIFSENGSGKRLMLASGMGKICAGKCGAENIILSPDDMNRVFNFATVGTEVIIK